MPSKPGGYFERFRDRAMFLTNCRDHDFLSHCDAPIDVVEKISRYYEISIYSAIVPHAVRAYLLDGGGLSPWFVKSLNNCACIWFQLARALHYITTSVEMSRPKETERCQLNGLTRCETPWCCRTFDLAGRCSFSGKLTVEGDFLSPAGIGSLWCTTTTRCCVG